MCHKQSKLVWIMTLLTDIPLSTHIKDIELATLSTKGSRRGPIDHFIIFEPQNPWIDVSELHKGRGATDVKALKLLKGWPAISL